MPYRIEFAASAARQLRKLDPKIRSQIQADMIVLREDPRCYGTIKLKGRDAYRLRSGVYRVVYTIEDARLLVEVVEVAHRREVYD